jgi:hypothetical protein
MSALSGSRPPIRSVVGRLYPCIGLLFSVDSLSFLLVNSAVAGGRLCFLRSTLNPFLIMGCGKQWKPAAMPLFVTCYMRPAAARAKEVASVPLLGPYGRRLCHGAGRLRIDGPLQSAG